MQPQEIEKIKQLVKVSSILSPSEKEEWLALAEIMNDKQLWELRKILETTIKSEIRNPKSETAIPQLTHILNLPSTKSQRLENRDPFDKLRTGKRIEASPPPSGQKAGFWQNIKDVLKEKELPPGHQEPTSELQLTSRVSTSPANNVRASKNFQFPISNFQLKQKPLPPLPKPPLVPRPPVKPEPLKQPFTAPLKESLLQKEVTGLAEQALGKGPRLKFSDDQVFVPGLQDARILVDAKLAKPKSQPAPPPKLEPPVKPAAKSPPAFKQAEPEKSRRASPAGLNSLEQISALTEQDASRDLSAPLKSLSARVGYHKLLAALEKSPLFQAYINTGLSVLSGKQGLKTGQGGGKILSREEFEKFVDVLRNIKS